MRDVETALACANERRLLTCLRWDARGDGALAGLSDADWTSLVALLRAWHGLHFLSRRLDSGVGVVPPQWVGETLRGQSKVMLARVFQTIATLQPCFADIDHPVLLLKGFDLAHRVYPHPGVRPMGDCDFLVPPERVMAMDAVMRRHGYRRDDPLNDAIINDGKTHHVQYRPIAGTGLVVELHWRLSTISTLGRERPIAPILARSLPLGHPALPANVRVMGREDMFLYLCEHIAHHRFETSLIQVWDLAEVVRWAGEAFDWPTFWSYAEAARLTNAVRLCLHQLEEAIGVTVPAAMATARGEPLPPRVAHCVPDVLPKLGLHFRGREIKDSHLVSVVLSKNQTLSDWLSWAKDKTSAPVDLNSADAGPLICRWFRRIGDGLRFLLARRRLLRLWLTDKARLREQARRVTEISTWVANG